jgi:hypothetical protein
MIIEKEKLRENSQKVTMKDIDAGIAACILGFQISNNDERKNSFIENIAMLAMMKKYKEDAND